MKNLQSVCVVERGVVVPSQGVKSSHATQLHAQQNHVGETNPSVGYGHVYKLVVVEPL